MHRVQVRAAARLAVARRFLVTVALMAIPMLAAAQSADMYKDRIRTWSSIAALPDAAFGERYDLYKGELSFYQEDLRLPGTGPDIVVGRTFAVGGTQLIMGPRGFQDWEIATPRVVTKSVASPVWQAAGSSGYTSNRCTYFGGQPANLPNFNSHTWWNGIQLVTQDGSTRDAMKRAASNTQAPGGATSTYTGVTKDQWQFSCLTQTANSQPGEAMLGLAPDGTRYWFDWLVLSDNANVEGKQDALGNWVHANFYKAMLLVTRIEDRFGNYLTYTYNDKKLMSISGGDGRLVSFTWSGDGNHITGMTAAGRNWIYEYSDGLSRLVYPDGSDMRFNLVTLGGQETVQSTLDCNPTPTESSMLDFGPDPTQYSGSITGPSGLIGTFTVQQKLHGRSRVPASCTTIDNASTATVAALYIANSLVARQYSGQGGINLSWQYQYSAPAASWSSCTTCPTTATTTVVDPDGTVSRSTYSTEWGAYEGKLVLEEDGVTSGGVLRTTAYQYAPTAGMAYPDTIGHVPANFTLANDAPANTHAPIYRKVVTQQGRTFTWEVASTCGSNGTSLCFDQYARPTKIVKSSTP